MNAILRDGGKAPRPTLDRLIVGRTRHRINARCMPDAPNNRVAVDYGPIADAAAAGWRRVLYVWSSCANMWCASYYRHDHHDAFRISCDSRLIYRFSSDAMFDATVVDGVLTRFSELGTSYYVPASHEPVREMRDLLCELAARYDALR